MGIYREKYLRLTVKRHTDDEPIDWYFDLNEQADAAIKLCEQHSAFVVYHHAHWQKEPPPADEFVSDANEFKAWLFDVET